MSYNENIGLTLLHEYKNVSANNEWNSLFQRIKNNSSMKMADFECSIARSGENRFKNAFRDVVPYDFNRVILSRKFKDDCDYINGSYIRLHGRSYITTQYPDIKTVHLFWSMAWQCKSPGIIMLCKEVDNGTSSYFPKLNEEIVITDPNDTNQKMYVLYTESEISYDGFVQKKLWISNVETNEKRDVWHFEFWSWPDQGTPQCIRSFLTLLGVIRQYNVVDSIIGTPIVHCSAGAGRTGTFCLIDIALSLAEKEGNLESVNIPNLMEDLRCQRMGMVRSFVQLKYCYEAVMEAFKRYTNNTHSISDGAYLLTNDDEDHICANSVVNAPSSSCSDDSESDVIMYIASSDESDANNDNDHFYLDLSRRNSLEEGNECRNAIDEASEPSLLNQSEIASYRLHRQLVIKQRKLRNHEEIAILGKHLQENSLKRYRLISTITKTSSALLDGLNNEQYISIIVATGAVLFMGTYCWLKYSPFK